MFHVKQFLQHSVAVQFSARILHAEQTSNIWMVEASLAPSGPESATLARPEAFARAFLAGPEDRRLSRNRIVAENQDCRR